MTLRDGSKHPATWRERIRAAADAVDTAYAFRAAEFKRAHDGGLSMRQIAEAAEMSTTGVHRVLGGGRHHVSLDEVPADDVRAMRAALPVEENR